MGQLGFFDLPDHLKRLSEAGDPLEEMAQIIDFEGFRPALEVALAYGDGAKGGRPPYEPVAMFKVLILAAQNTVSDGRMEFLIRDRLSWLRFLGFELGHPTPDENTIRSFRERLTPAEAIRRLFDLFDQQLRAKGYLAMGGQIVDASLVSAPRQRNTRAEKEAIKAGKTARQIWPDKPAKAAQKDTEARGTVKTSKGKLEADGTMKRDIAIPEFGYKTHISIDRRHGFIRRQKVTDAAAHDGARLREGLIDPRNTASSVWADTADRSKANEDFLADLGKTSRIHGKKPLGKPMPKRTAKANAAKSRIRTRIEHVFAQQKDRMHLAIRSISIKRAEATIIMVNLAYNLGRWRWWEGKTASA